MAIVARPAQMDLAVLSKRPAQMMAYVVLRNVPAGMALSVGQRSAAPRTIYASIVTAAPRPRRAEMSVARRMKPASTTHAARTRRSATANAARRVSSARMGFAAQRVFPTETAARPDPRALTPASSQAISAAIRAPTPHAVTTVMEHSSSAALTTMKNAATANASPWVVAIKVNSAPRRMSAVPTALHATGIAAKVASNAAMGHALPKHRHVVPPERSAETVVALMEKSAAGVSARPFVAIARPRRLHVRSPMERLSVATAGNAAAAISSTTAAPERLTLTVARRAAPHVETDVAQEDRLVSNRVAMTTSTMPIVVRKVAAT